MRSYSVRDVERVLQLSRRTMRGLIRAGFVSPGARPAARVSLLLPGPDRAARRARAHAGQHSAPSASAARSSSSGASCPEAMPLSGLAICAVGDRVVVREGDSRWQADTASTCWDSMSACRTACCGWSSTARDARRRCRAAADARLVRRSDWRSRATRSAGPRSMPTASAAEADPHNAAAWINLGRLLHEQGETREAEGVYRPRARACRRRSAAALQPGRALEDLGDKAAALAAYHGAHLGGPGLRRLPLQPGAAV